MPTVSEALKTRVVVPIGGNLKPHQQPTRLLLTSQEVIEWMKAVLPKAKSDGVYPGAASPLEQAAGLFNRFVAGDDFQDPLPHPMRPTEQGIYRLRTPDVRMDGWFPEKCCFVIGAIELTQNCKRQRGLDDQLRDLAINLRTTLQINNGTYLTGSYNDHL